VAAATCIDDARTIVAEGMTGDETRGRGDVRARLEDAHQMVDIGPLGVVHDTVGPEGQQGIDVVGGEHPDGIDAAQLPDVPTDLVGTPRVAPDDLEPGIGQRGQHRPLSDVPRGPLHDPAHRHSPRRVRRN